MKKRCLLCFFSIFLLTLTGCGQAAQQLPDAEISMPVEQRTSDEQKVEPVQDCEEAVPTEKDETEQIETSDEEKDAGITPYQLLNLMAGNAETLSFTYTQTNSADAAVETGELYRSGDKTAVIFTAENMLGETVVVRELEMDGFVYYILEHKEQVFRYPGPADDIVLYQMMAASSTEPVEIKQETDGTGYTYHLPFEQDDQLSFVYAFYMQNDALTKLEKSLNGYTQCYSFSRLSQEPIDEAVFLIPSGYEQMVYEYPLGDAMPPWWE